jgi:hypothetical protein
MSTTDGPYITAEAGADLHTNQYYIAKLDATNKAVLTSAAADEVSGILDDVPQGANGSCSIRHISASGVHKVRAGAAFSKGAYLCSDGTGRAIAAVQTTAGSAPTKRVFGRARAAAAAPGDIVEFEHCYFLY